MNEIYYAIRRYKEVIYMYINIYIYTHMYMYIDMYIDIYVYILLYMGLVRAMPFDQRQQLHQHHW